MNAVQEMHLREIDNNKTIAYFNEVHPTFTVISKENGVFYNARTDLTNSFKQFYKNCRQTIDYYKNKNDIVNTYNDDDLGVYYMSCITNLSLESMVHPVPANNYISSSVPRVFWDKYKFDESTQKFFVTLNITVSHALVDGFPLAQAFNNLIDNINNIENVLND